MNRQLPNRELLIRRDYDSLLSIISLKNNSGSAPLNLKSKRIFQLALYDMDAFRARVATPGFLGPDAPRGRTLQRLMDDETALLEFGHEWVCRVLFGQTDEAVPTQQPAVRRPQTQSSPAPR